MPTTKNEPKKRTRIPMDKFRAAVAIDRILAQIPPEQRLAVLEFVRQPVQLMLSGTTGNA